MQWDGIKKKHAEWAAEDCGLCEPPPLQHVIANIFFLAGIPLLNHCGNNSVIMTQRNGGNYKKDLAYNKPELFQN